MDTRSAWPGWPCSCSATGGRTAIRRRIADGEFRPLPTVPDLTYITSIAW